MDAWSPVRFNNLETTLLDTIPVEPIKLTKIEHVPASSYVPQSTEQPARMYPPKYAFLTKDRSVVDDSVIYLDLDCDLETKYALEACKAEKQPIVILAYDDPCSKLYMLGEYMLTVSLIQCPCSKGWFPYHNLLRITKHPDAHKIDGHVDLDLIFTDDLLAAITDL